MAQSALTVTPPNPTPPTNMSCTGATPPNPPNFTKATYADWLDNTKFDSAPPPYYDDGAAGSLLAFAANTAALASGSAGTAGGTENSYPGATNGVVPASTSLSGGSRMPSWKISVACGLYVPAAPPPMSDWCARLQAKAMRRPRANTGRAMTQSGR